MLLFSLALQQVVKNVSTCLIDILRQVKL